MITQNKLFRQHTVDVLCRKEYNLSNLYLALFIGCKTGYGGVGGNNLPTKCVQLGADCAVGFTQDIDCYKANEWVKDCFYYLCEEDYSVNQTCSYFENLNKYIQTGLESYIICGASGTHL